MIWLILALEVVIAWALVRRVPRIVNVTVRWTIGGALVLVLVFLSGTVTSHAPGEANVPGLLALVLILGLAIYGALAGIRRAKSTHRSAE